MAPYFMLERTEGTELERGSLDLTFHMMGKSQKFSRGHSSGFVPDYTQAVETVGETDGFGCSVRVDSEDSSAPKRKCISLNRDTCNGFDVPLQVISLSRISRSERKEMKMKLRVELQQIQNLQKRLNSKIVPSNSGVALSSSSNAHVNKRDPVGSNGPPMKRGISGRFVSKKTARPPSTVSSSDVLLMKQCEQVLKRLMGHQYAWVFNTPVDVVKLKLHDYYAVIKHPIDLGTIKRKIATGAYSNPLAFVADVRLTFTNAMTYNPPGNDVHIMADQMSKWFEHRWKPIEKKLAAADSSIKQETEAVKMVPQSKKRKDPPSNHKVVVHEQAKPRVTVEEKQFISKCLESLLVELPEHIVEFLRRHGDDVNQPSEDEIEIDIDSLSDDTLRKLRKLLDDHLQEKQVVHPAKADPCGIEMINDTGVSNPVIHPCKENEPADEDVDIGNNDPPMPSYPPVEIEKDTVRRSSKCSSSSNSSSGYGSSSSGSDSGSSSGSELNGKVACPAKTVKGSAGCEVSWEQEKSDVMDPHDMNRTSNGSDKVEQAVHDEPVSLGTDGITDGENALSERQVSPEKLYRAALLRSRFADTILKAREKTLDQTDKGDPEKLRREREELERQQREERARLQAEAKAAEEARLRAEAEAAAEAKRRREFERETARQALLKIEKTVEINENSLILKDLEMFGSIPGELVPNSVDETSPDHSQDGMSGFRLGGTNPLEQLGLYMKVDDEDEEDAEPNSIPVTDVEEGEID